MFHYTQKRIVTLAAVLFLGILIFLSRARPGSQYIYKTFFSQKNATGTAQENQSAATLVNAVAPAYQVHSDLPEPNVKAEAYLVRFVGEDIPILKRRESKPLPPASITKLMTVLLTQELLDPRDLILFSREAKDAGEKMSGANMGDTFSRDDMIRLAFIGSSNDAALALAEAVGKTRGAYVFDDAVKIFVDLMNVKRDQLELTHSYFKNPIGLDQDGHLMSAEDIARIMEHLFLYYPGLAEISRTVATTVYSRAGKEYTIENTNELLKEFPAILASKTGLTDNAKGALAMLYPVRTTESRGEDGGTQYDGAIYSGANPLRNGRIVSIVILGSEDRFGDGRKIVEWLEEKF